MALFNAEDLKDQESTQTILLDFFVIPEGEETPTLTVKVSKKFRKLSATLSSKYNNLVFEYQRKKTQATPINRPDKYCLELLQEVYSDSLGLFDTPIKKDVLILVENHPKMARLLAPKLIDVYESAELFKDEMDDEKNSDGL